MKQSTKTMIYFASGLCFLSISVTFLVITLLRKPDNPRTNNTDSTKNPCPEGQSLQGNECKIDMCLRTHKTYEEGARCEGAPYRKTGDWCCSEYGRRKLYKWTLTPANE